MKSGSWPKRSGVQLVFQVILTVFSAIEGRVLWRPLKLFQTKLSKSCIFSPCYMYWACLVMLVSLVPVMCFYLCASNILRVGSHIGVMSRCLCFSDHIKVYPTVYTWKVIDLTIIVLIPRLGI